ncbi:hypothetical protein [Duncaniella muris]|uniref:hypothetical protein n=1 Tax=Duncaniella muris TaxID=2094150 RepID=UPI0025B6B65D|nr:hypothetical protein [Duncaniella muris]
MSFKQILCIFASIIIGAIIIVQLLPKPKLSFSDKQELLRTIEKLNSELPRKIGTIGQLDCVTYDTNVITYHFTNFGDSSIDSFYEDNYNEIGGIMKYSAITLNGQNNAGDNLAKLLDSKGLIMRIEFKTPSNKIFQWNYTGKDILEFMKSIRISPTEALCTIIDAHIKLANLSLPMESNYLGCVNTIITNSIESALGQGENLLKILHDSNGVVFVCETNEQETSIPEIREYLNNPFFIDNFTTLLSEDADMLEFMNMLVLSHSNLTYRMKNVASTDSIDVIIPYVILKNKCNHLFRNQL